MKLVTSAEMRALETAAVEAGISEKQLMEEAGLAVAQEAWMLLGSLDGRRIVVLAGPGNNGGDGLVAARHLCDWGADVAVWVARARKDTSLEPELEQREIPIVQGDDDPSYERLDTLLAAAELVIDALLGIGQKRPLEPEEPITVALRKLGEARKGFSPPKVVAVDLPTGINADSGAVDPAAVEPDITVTFGLPKVGMYQAPASALLGRVQVVDIGIPKVAQDSVQLELLTARWAKNTLPRRPEDSNKGTFGKLLIVGGSRNYIGAPRLAATAAYRAGAGLVTVACPEGILPVLAGSLAEATWLPQEEADDGGLTGESAIALRSAWHGFSAAVVGPGLGDTNDTRAFVWAVLADIAADLPGGAVVDADALNAIATFSDAHERVPANAVLTPHPGELARLMKTTVPDIQSRRLEVAKGAAAAFGCVVVLKGAATVIAAADGRARMSPFSNPLLATAGSGDILAGIIGAYLAQGLAPFEAACLGVYVHAATGEALRADFGTSGLLALDIATRLPGVVRDIAAS